MTNDQEKTFLREELQKMKALLEVTEYKLHKSNAYLLLILRNMTPKSEMTDDVRDWNLMQDEAWAFLGVKRGSENEI